MDTGEVLSFAVTRTEIVFALKMEAEQCFVCAGYSPALCWLNLIHSSGWLGPGKALTFVPAGVLSTDVVKQHTC